jgi:hypothetical protein
VSIISIIVAVELLNQVLLSGCDSPLLVDYAERLLSGERLFRQEIDNSSNSLSPSNNSTMESVETTVSFESGSSNQDSNRRSSEEKRLSPYPGDFPSSSRSSNHPSLGNFVSETPCSNQLIRVILRGVPPEFDIMSFSFLKSFGTILDGNVVSDLLKLYAPDGSSQLSHVYTGMVTFTLLTHSSQSTENLMLFHEALGSFSSTPFLFNVSAVIL